MSKAQELAKSVAESVKGYVERRLSGLSDSIAQIREELDAYALDLKSIAARAPEPGPAGKDGRDAASIEVVDMDEFRSYPRGTFAHYRGGLVRAFRKTDSMEDWKGSLEKHGWAVAMNGVADVAYEQKGERTVVIRTVMTDGTERSIEHSTPTMIYRGVWKERDHQPGDTVTWGGSLWHCDEPTSEKPGSKGWTLAAKRGRDGKDLTGDDRR